MFKRNTLIALLALAPAAHLGAQQGMSEEQMQQMMQGAMEMANCFQTIDQEKMQAMVQKGEALEKELRQLCADGERDHAQRKAVAFGREFASSDEFKQLQQCGEMARRMIDGMPDYLKGVMPEDGNGDNRHVCDALD